LRVFGYSGHETRPVTQECTTALRLGIWETIARSGISRHIKARFFNYLALNRK
jgi:hypothetical protein